MWELDPFSGTLSGQELNPIKLAYNLIFQMVGSVNSQQCRFN